MNSVYQTEEITVRLLETKDEPTLVKWLSDGRPIGYIQFYELEKEERTE